MAQIKVNRTEISYVNNQVFTHAIKRYKLRAILILFRTFFRFSAAITSHAYKLSKSLDVITQNVVSVHPQI